MRTGIVGLGNLGSAVANLVAGNGHLMIGWEYNAAVVDEINRQRTNGQFLPDVAMHPNLMATTDLAAVFKNTEVVFIAVPSVFIQRTLPPLRGQIAPEIVLVNMANGMYGAQGVTS